MPLSQKIKKKILRRLFIINAAKKAIVLPIKENHINQKTSINLGNFYINKKS